MIPETKEELRALRLSLGLTQQEAAIICGVFLRTYVRWEHGESGFTWRKVEPLAKVATP